MDRKLNIHAIRVKSDLRIHGKGQSKLTASVHSMGKTFVSLRWNSTSLYAKIPTQVVCT
jgi:hypothetical protein